MNISFHLPLTAWGHLTRRLSFVLLPALISEASASIIPPVFNRHERSQPYLRVCLPPPLRFSPPPVPPEISDPTLVMGPPNPGGPLEAISAANKESISPEAHDAPAPSPSTSAQPQPIPSSPAAAASNAATTTATPPSPASQTPVSQPPAIIPDDTPRAVHPEDLLPYFRIPASPATTLPASSATYQQQ